MELERDLPARDRLGHHRRDRLCRPARQRKRNINQLQPGTVQANPGINVNALRPFVGLGILGLAENSGLSQYNGLQISIERRVATDLHFGVAYTYSSSSDNGSSLTDVLPNSFSDKNYWGHSDFDRRHVFILNSIYDVPFLKGSSSWTRRLLGNWQFSGIFQAQSGTPFSVRNNVDYAGVGAGSGNQFWNMTYLNCPLCAKAKPRICG
jgi:hypothetical protein